MRVCRIVYLLQLPLLLLLERSSGVSNVRRTQITSPWNIKGAVPKSHEEQPNSSRENSWGHDNSKLSLEECIMMRNGRYVVCSTSQRESRKQGARTKRRQSENSNGAVRSKEVSREWLRRPNRKLRGSVGEINAFFKEEDSTDFLRLFEEIQVFQEEIFKSHRQTRHSKRHVLHHHSSSGESMGEWIYEPHSYVVYDVSVPLVIAQWPTISPEYIQEIHDMFLETNLNRYYEENPIIFKKHIHDYGEGSEEPSDNENLSEDSSEDEDEQVSLRMASIRKIPKELKKPKNAPLSHMLQHIYPPYPMNKTVNKRY